MSRSNATVDHILREGNRLANHALDFGYIEEDIFWELQKQGRMIVNDENSQCLYTECKSCNKLERGGATR